MPHSSADLTTETKPLPLPKRQRSSRQVRNVWRKPLGLGALLLCALFLFTSWPHYAGTAVCQTCGIRRDYYAWETRFSPLLLHRFTTDHPTAVSRALGQDQPAPAHSHHWTTPVIVSSEATKADETPLNLLYSVETPRVARFAEGLALYTNQDVLGKWKRVILDPQYSVVLAPSLRFMRFPENGFSDSKTFRAWWHRAEFPLWNRLRELTEPD